MTDPSNWYKKFFNGLAVEMWHVAVPESLTIQEIDFICRTIDLREGVRVLDLFCGSGRIATRLAQKGAIVTGIDISQQNIDLLHKTRGGDLVNAICADVLEYDFDGMYDHAVCMGNSFSYFDRAGMTALCRKVFRALMPGAKFIINTGTLAESLLPNLKDKNTMEVQDILFSIRNEYLTGQSLLKTHMKFQRRQEIEEKTAWHYVFACAEMIGILKEAGFEKTNLYSDTSGTLLNVRDPNAYIVAEK